MMKIKLILAGIVTLFATNAFAETLVIYGTAVEKSQPIYQVMSTPQKSCWIEERQVQRKRSGGDDLGSFLGGAIIGGVIGNQIDKNAAGIGAIIGGAIANENQKKHNGSTYWTTVREKVCETTYVEERNVIGWRTQVRVNGKIVTIKGSKKYWSGNRVPLTVEIKG